MQTHWANITTSEDIGQRGWNEGVLARKMFTLPLKHDTEMGDLEVSWQMMIAIRRIHEHHNIS